MRPRIWTGLAALAGTALVSMVTDRPNANSAAPATR